ncbi:thioredoxin family protein [bacterium]|nr:thioredoxin family protein [bacterium]
MSIRILIYGKEGEGSAFAALAQVRSLVGEMRLDASVKMVSDPAELKNSGVDTLPAVSVDGFMVSQGWVPSRNELKRALSQRQDQVSGKGSTLY